jgi:hypothetical protein
MKQRIVFALALILFAPVIVQSDTPWRRLVYGDAALYCREGDLKNGERIVEVIERTFPRILADLDMAEPESLTVFLAATREEFRGLTRGRVPDWSSGAADPARSVLYLQSPRFADPDEIPDKVVAHELAHAVLGMALDGAAAERWFDEGFAMLEAEEGEFGGTVRLWWAFVFGEAVPLAEIDGVLQFNRDKAALAYQESLSAVRYLIERYGRDSVPMMVEALRSGRSMDEAVFSATGLRIQPFESEWFKVVKRKSGTVFLLDISFIVSAVFVALFFAALASTRIRTSRIQKTWDQDPEGMGPTNGAPP